MAFDSFQVEHTIPGNTHSRIQDPAEVSGFPRTRSHMLQTWKIGPLEVLDADKVSVAYTATDTNDSRTLTPEQQTTHKAKIKLVDISKSYLLRQFAGGRELEMLDEKVGRLGGRPASSFADPVGRALTVNPQGRGNGRLRSDRT